ncbi:MAG: glycosyltransferase family 4 protein [bacterium]
MHLLLIHQAFVGPDEPGGTRHFEFGRYLVKKGHRISVVTSKTSYLTGKRISNSEGFLHRQRIQGLEICRIATAAGLHKNFITRIISFFSFTITAVIASLSVKNIDVVMGTSPPIFQALSAWFIAEIRKKPFLLEIRDLWPEFAVDMGVLKNPILIQLSRSLERFLYNRADHLLVNSPAYQDYLIDRGIRESRISFISNGVDPEMFTSDKHVSHMRKTLDLNNKFIVTYTGALGPANDIYTILRAAKIINNNQDITFLLIGDGKERKNLENYVHRNKLSNVMFTSTKPKNKIREYLLASDVCIATLMNIPMFITTYPNKVFDYMAAGKPTILGIDGVIRDVIEQSKGGIFVSPGDQEAITEAVLHLYNDRDLAKEMGENAREYVKKYFNRTDQAKQFCILVEGMHNL